MKEKKNNYGQELWKVRAKYCKWSGYDWKEVERVINQGKQMRQEFYRRDFHVQKQERKREIRHSRYNNRYLKKIDEVEPQYLTTKNKEIMIHFTYGNEEKGNKFCVSNEKRVRRMCRNYLSTVGRMMKNRDEPKKERKVEKKQMQ